jgi:hypothetical protein
MHLPRLIFRGCPSPGLTRAMLIVAAAAATHTLWTASYWLTDIDLRVNDGQSTVSALNVLGATVLAGSIAWIVAVLLERFVRRAKTAWTVGCCCSLGGSLLGPLSAGANTGATIVLITMHFAVAAILILGIRQTLHDR